MADKILVIEDEISLQETLSYNLEREGYIVSISGDGLGGLHIAREWMPDLVLLDVMLPSMDGFEVCRKLKAEMDLPILMLTARADEIDRVVGLEIGADDYIVKPFSMRELMVRVKTHLRVYHKLQANKASGNGTGTLAMDEIKIGNLVLDKKRHEVLMDNQPLDLKPREYDLMVYLIENIGRAVSRELILERVWGWDYIGESRTIDVHIRWLRSKIEKDPANPTRIITVPGIGYRFDG